MKPKCEESLSNFAFNLNLRHYTPAYHLLAAMLCSCDLTDMRIARARHAAVTDEGARRTQAAVDALLRGNVPALERALGGAVQAHLALRAPGLTPRGFQRLNLKYDGPLSKVAFNCNLRPYTKALEHSPHHPHWWGADPPSRAHLII